MVTASQNEIRQRKDEEGKKRGVSVERSKASTTEKPNLDGPTYPIQDTIIINIISQFFIIDGKKFNTIQLKETQNGLEHPQKNNPPSRETSQKT